MMKFRFIFQTDENGYRTGEIVEMIDSEFVIVQFDSRPDFVPPAEVFSITELSLVNEDGIKEWALFQTREALNEWLAWLEKPSDESSEPRPALNS